MTLVMAVCVAVTFGVGIFMLLGKELKGIAMGVFMLSHAANLSILTMSGSPVTDSGQMKSPPIIGSGATLVDPLPQALILTAIVIGFAVMGFLLTLIVLTGKGTGTLDVDELAREQ